MSAICEVALLEVRLHHALVEVGDLLAQLGARELRLVLQLGRHVAHREVLALARLVVDDALHFKKVDDALEAVLLADGQFHGACVRLQLIAHLLHDAGEVRAHAVHLVNERDAGNAVTVRLPPHGLALRLHATDCTEHAHSAVEDAQGALHLHREVHVSGRVDDVDGAPLPLAGDGGGLDGDATFLLLHHEVGCGIALMYLAGLVDLAGVEEDALGRGGLARVDVGHDADVAYVG